MLVHLAHCEDTQAWLLLMETTSDCLNPSTVSHLV